MISITSDLLITFNLYNRTLYFSAKMQMFLINFARSNPLRKRYSNKILFLYTKAFLVEHIRAFRISCEKKTPYAIHIGAFDDTCVNLITSKLNASVLSKTVVMNLPLGAISKVKSKKFILP